MTEPYSYKRGISKWSSRFLDTVGNGTGSIDMNVNGSITAVPFLAVAGSNETIILDRLIVHVSDVGGLDAGYYGNNITMTNGITFGISRVGGGIESMTTQLPIKTNTDWAAYCYDVSDLSFGLGNNILGVRYTFAKDGAPLLLNPGDYFWAFINDDLTGLAGHHMRLGMISSTTQ